MPRHGPSRERAGVVRPTCAPCARRVIACDVPDAAAYASGERQMRDEVVATWLLLLAGELSQCVADGLVLIGEGAEAVALGVQLLLNKVQHLVRDASCEQIRS